MVWSEVLAGLVAVESAGPAKVEIGGVQYDSRRVGAGDVFVAMRGGSADGNRFVSAALDKGAVAVVTDSREAFDLLQLEKPGVPVALVTHGRRALAEVSSVVFGRPQDKLKVSAVTGTNGKTTTAWLLVQMLESVGRKCVLIGTIETRIAGLVRESEHTTPESRDLLEIFAEGVRAGCTEVVMEMSSHALEQERVWGIPVDLAVFTNLTQDHLDYHGTMEKYANAKAKLFTGVGAPPPRIAVVNIDDDASILMEQAASQAGSEVWTYGMSGPYIADGDVWDVPIHGREGRFLARYIALSSSTLSFDLVSHFGEGPMDADLAGRVNVYNLLASSCAALARGLSLGEVVAASKLLRSVPGRFEVVPGSQGAGFSVVVDYAHTDDALKNLIALGHGLVGEHGGRVITMFGCGGDRDRTKRAKMGRVAGADSDLVVVTSDNPRSEEPMAIINEIVLGVRETKATVVVEEDRRAAIEVAIRAAKPGDIVLLAGKGHEKVQIFADGAVPFDDVAVAAEVLRALVGDLRRD